MKIITKLISIICFAGIIAFSGCKTEGDCDNCCDACSTPAYTTSSGFGDEVYVWEAFIFSTNRVEQVK